MNRTGDFSPLYGYLLVVLLPLVVPDHLLSSKNWVVFVLTVTAFVAIGCIIGRLFPSVYRTLVLPLFKENDFRMISYVLNEGEGAQGGFVSQSGYASYFLCIGIGALYCFRSHFKTKTIVFLFDIKNETVKYAEERIVISQKTSYSPEGDVYSPEQLLLECISDLDVSLDVIGEAYFNIKDELEEMFSWKELDLPYIYDRGCYTVFLKNGKRKRRISIQEEMYYSPYLRLLRFFHDIVELMKEGK